MPSDKKHNVLLNSKIAVGVGLAILLILGFALIAQGFVDTQNYRDEVIRVIEAQTKRKVTIKGAVTVSLLPVPTLYIPGVELRDPTSDIPAPSASVDLISIRVGFLSAFTKHPEISDITLDHPTLELVRGEDNLVHWDWLNADLIKALVSSEGPQKPLRLDVNYGRILYHDNNADKSVALENVNARITSGASLAGYGGFVCFGHEINFSFSKDASQASPDTAPYQFKMTSGNDFVELKGRMDTTKDLPELKGQLSLDFADASIWIKPKQIENEKFIDTVARNASQQQRVALPLKIESDWSQHGLSVVMDNLHLAGLNSTGVGKLQLAWKDWKPLVGVDMAFSVFDLDAWKNYITVAFTGKKKDFYSKVYHDDADTAENPLSKNIELSLNLIAEKVKVGNQAWDNAKLSAVMADSAITVNHFGVELPGKSSLSMFGVVTPSASNDLRFEGSMETSGKSLRSLLTVFDDSASGLPETGFGDFSARSNIFVSSEQLRLSDADVKLTELHLNGGLVAYFDSSVRLEADVRLKNINFDYFRDAWREKRHDAKDTDFFLKFDRSMNFNWLKKLQATIDFRVSVDKFTFLDHAGDSASFRVYARNGDLGIYDINFIYPTDIMKGHFKLNVNGEQPLIDLALSTGFLDTSYFSARTSDAIPAPDSALTTKRIYLASAADDKRWLEIAPQAQLVESPDESTLPPKEATGLDDLRKNAKPQNPSAENAIYKRWPEDLIDMSWMNGLSGVIDLSVGKLLHKGLEFDNLRLQTKFSNNLMVFNTLTFSYWGGQCSVLGSLYGGKVPGFVISFSLSDMHLGDMLKDLTGRENVYGNVSINATLNTSGVNMLSWVTQAEGKMVLVGRGVSVQGLDLQSAANAVAVSRTASDVANGVNARLVDGSTTFSVDGNINVKNGMLRTPGIALKTGQILGNLIGEVKLINWTMDLTTLFQFPELSTETVPTMSVQLNGPLKSGEMRTDTSSLEAYVAKRIISK